MSAGHFFERQAEFAQRLVDEARAELDGLLPAQTLEVVTHGGARLGGHHEIHPRRIRHRALGGDDLHGLAVAQRSAQRRQAPIYLGGDAAVADVGVHGVGEVHHGGAARQAQDLALGREHVDLVGEQVDLDALEEVLGGAALLHVDQVREPLARAIVLAALGLVDLVFPVRGDAGLGHAMHVLGADLHFDGNAVGAEQRGVQRLVAVDARDRDVVLEAAGHGLVGRVHHAERAITGIRPVDHDAQAEHVDDLGERRALAQHLAVDAVQMFLARADLGLEVRLDQRHAHGVGDLVEELLLVAAGLLQRTVQHACSDAETPP